MIIWHKNLLVDDKKITRKQYVKLIKSYLSNKLFKVKQEDYYLVLTEINTRAPQGTVLGPVLYFMYTNEQGTAMATAADNNTVLTLDIILPQQ